MVSVRAHRHRRYRVKQGTDDAAMFLTLFPIVAC